MTIVPAYLTPAWRYAGDDWSESNALAYTVYATPPVYASDGVTIITAGVPQDLTGATVLGTIRYAANPSLSLIAPSGAVVDAVNGKITLSLASNRTASFTTQPYSDYNDPTKAMLIIQPRVSLSGIVTVGLQQLFVF